VTDDCGGIMTGAKARIVGILGRYVTDPAELAAVDRGEPFLSATSLDSLAMMTVIVEIEKAFGVRFDLATLEDTFATIDSVTAYLDSKAGS
jgi:acyl carrier protein